MTTSAATSNLVHIFGRSRSKCFLIRGGISRCLNNQYAKYSCMASTLINGYPNRRYDNSTRHHQIGKLYGIKDCTFTFSAAPHRTLFLSGVTGCSKTYNMPLSPNDMPRPGGIATMMRLPYAEDTTDLDACFVGVPIDIGTSNRPGARFGPRHIRNESVLLKLINLPSGADPFRSIQVADVGDVSCSLYNMETACRQIRTHFDKLVATGCRPLTMGGDHTISYPILQAMKDKYGPVGLIHVDAHNDTTDEMFGAKIAHGTPFRRAVEEQLIDCSRVVQIGLRGSNYSPNDLKWGKDQGFRVVLAEDCWHKSLVPLMKEVQQQMGDKPVYLSFDIDGLDPCHAPGTGTPEFGGLTVIQGLELIRGCRGLNIIGADLVEVAPQYDTTGNTSLLGANLLFEMLCILPGVKHVEI